MGLEPVSQRFKVAEQDPILSVQGGGGRREQETLSGIHPLCPSGKRRWEAVLAEAQGREAPNPCPQRPPCWATCGAGRQSLEFRGDYEAKHSHFPLAH